MEKGVYNDKKMFTVKPQILFDEAERLKNAGNRIDDFSRTARRIMLSLDEDLNAEGKEEIIEALNRVIEQLGEEYQNVTALVSALESISEMYSNTEKTIIAEAEETALKQRSVSVGYRDVTSYKDKLSGMRFI